MKILSAPIYALFNKDFYRLVLNEPTSKGFKYLAYLSGISLLIIWFALGVYFMPRYNDLAEWLQTDLPSMTWTPDGLTMNARSPYDLVHPAVGPVAVFDMTKENISSNEMGDYMVYVTSKTLYLREGADGLRVYDLSVPREEKDASFEDTVQQIDGDIVFNMMQQSKPLLWIFGSLILFPAFYAWKLIEVLIYSGLGYLINMMRKEPLPYEKIFLLGCFIVTPLTLIQLRGLLIPLLYRIPFGWIGSFLVAGLYYYYILKVCDPEVDGHLPESV